MPPKRAYRKKESLMVKPIITNEIVSNHRGANMFPDRYCNILILASKKSGKTTVLNHICKNSLTPKDKLVVFASTVNKDAIYEDLFNWCNSNNIETEKHEDFKDGRRNLIREFIRESQLESIPEEETKSPFEEPFPLWGSDHLVFTSNMGGINLPPKPIKVEKQIKDKTMILDDMGQDLRDKSVEDLLKTSRHYKTRVIISTQWLNDLTPASVRQLDYILLFKGLPDIKISELHRKITTATPEEEFINIYKRATVNPYSFLYIDVKRGNYRNNFI